MVTLARTPVFFVLLLLAIPLPLAHCQTTRPAKRVLPDPEIEAKLDLTVPELRFDNNEFRDVVDFLRDITAAHLFVNWHALKQVGIEPIAGWISLERGRYHDFDG